MIRGSITIRGSWDLVGVKGEEAAVNEPVNDAKEDFGVFGDVLVKVESHTFGVGLFHDANMGSMHGLDEIDGVVLTVVSGDDSAVAKNQSSKDPVGLCKVVCERRWSWEQKGVDECSGDRG